MAKKILLAKDIEQLENTSPVVPVIDPALGIETCRISSVTNLTEPTCRFYSATNLTQAVAAIEIAALA